MGRAAGIMGLGTRQVVKAEVDADHRLDPVRLDATLHRLKSEGHPVFAVTACACATPVGAFDPLDAVDREKHRPVARRRGTW